MKHGNVNLVNFIKRFFTVVCPIQYTNAFRLRPLLEKQNAFQLPYYLYFLLVQTFPKYRGTRSKKIFWRP